MARTPDEDLFFALAAAWLARRPPREPTPEPVVADDCIACGSTGDLVEQASGAYCLCAACHAVAAAEVACG